MEILITINTVTLFSLDITSKNMKKVKFNAKGCCNPFNEHSRAKFTNIRNVNESLVDKASFLRIFLSTGQKICQACAIKINRNYETRKNQSHRPRSDAYNLRTETATTTNLMESSDSETDQINPFPEYTGVDVPKIKSKLNELLPLLGMAKLDESKLRSDVYKKDVLNNVIDALSKHIFKGATVNKDSIEIIDQLKTKFNEFESYQDKLKLLSVAKILDCIPDSKGIQYFILLRNKIKDYSRTTWNIMQYVQKNRFNKVKRRNFKDSARFLSI